MSPWNPGIEISAVALSDCCITQTDGQLSGQLSECSDPSALFRIRFHANHKNKRTLIQRCIQGGEGLTVSGEQPAEAKRASHVPLLITAVAV